MNRPSDLKNTLLVEGDTEIGHVFICFLTKESLLFKISTL